MTPAAGPSRSGTVALLGWTNVGKSTLLNRLVGDKLAAVADVSQTTRFCITGVLHAEAGQIVFVDTPGVHAPRSKLNRAMLRHVHRAVHDADALVLVVDAARGPGPGDRQAAKFARSADAPRIVVLNKIDLVRPKARLLPMMRAAVDDWGFAEAWPVSARTGDGCAELVARLFELLPQAEARFPDDYLTDQPLRTLAAEWIREQLVAATRAELPHATAVLVDRWEERDDGLVVIHASILVERDSQKKIVIGRQARLLAAVGKAARQELERLLDRRVMLELWVKVRAGWRDDDRILRQLGM